MRIFEENFWKLMKRYSFGEAEGLIEAVPAETLPEKAKRKVDYARARLLTGSARSKRSMETATQLYEGLVASETDEDSLGKYFLHCVLDKAWAHAPGRVWLHTCELDHPAALPTYLQAGFVVFDEQLVEQVVP